MTKVNEFDALVQQLKDEEYAKLEKEAAVIVVRMDDVVNRIDDQRKAVMDRMTKLVAKAKTKKLTRKDLEEAGLGF